MDKPNELICSTIQVINKVEGWLRAGQTDENQLLYVTIKEDFKDPKSYIRILKIEDPAKDSIFRLVDVPFRNALEKNERQRKQKQKARKSFC